MESTETFKDKGNTEFKKGNFQAAIAHYTEGLLEEKSEQLYGNRAACYMKLSKYEEAVADCRSAIAIKPDYIKVIKRLIQGLIALGELKDAQQCIDEAAQLDKKFSKELENEVKVIKDLAISDSALAKAIDNKNWSSALYFTTEMIRHCPGSKELQLNQLEYMMEAGQTENAMRVSQSMFDSMNSNPKYLYLRGMVLANDGRMDQAKKFFVQALKNDPDYLTCQKALKKIKRTETLKTEASDLFKDNKYEEAIEGFNACLDLFPNNKTYNSSIYLNIAICHTKLKQNEKALEVLNKAIECKDDYAKAYVKRGEVQLLLENFEEAVRDFSSADRISPGEFGVKSKLKNAQVRLKQSKKKDLYKTLGISRDATPTEIKKAYKKSALRWHPDKNSGSEAEKAKAEKMFKDINEAYVILSDENKKARYDSGVDVEDIEGGGGGGFSGGAGMDPTQIFNMFFGGGMGGMGDSGFGGMGGGMGGGQQFFKRGSPGGSQFEFRFG